MANTYVRLAYDPTAKNPNNLIGSEPHTLKAISGFPYKIITMDNGGFYTQSVRVYDSNYDRLTLNTDYILTYRYVKASAAVGITICSDIVFLNEEMSGQVYVTAQMVGGDVAYSLTAIADYIDWFKQQPTGYIPKEYDFSGNEPVWQPGELEQARWELDTYQPFNNEIYEFGRATRGDTESYEQEFRDKVDVEYQKFLDQFTNQLTAHIEDKDNPHVDIKSQVNLGQVENYPLATEAEAIQAESNTLYVTPYTTWKSLGINALTPLYDHTGIINKNPHRLTPLQLDSPTKTVVQTVLDAKYGRHETVADTSYLWDNNAPYSYNDYYAYARSNIPADNFVRGPGNTAIDPRRIATGTPNARTANQAGAWVSWDSIIAANVGQASPQILVISGPGNFGQYASADAGHTAAVSQSWAYTAPIGSMIFYKNDAFYYWGVGNGVVYNGYVQVNASYKSAAGWIKM